MMPLNYTLRHYLQKYIPDMDDEQLAAYERLESRSIQHNYELMERISLHPRFWLLVILWKSPSGKLPDNIHRFSKDVRIEHLGTSVESSFKHMHTTFSPYKKSFDAIQKFWVVQRAFTMEQGHLLQFPHSIQDFRRFISMSFTYRKLQIQTFKDRWAPRQKRLYKIFVKKYPVLIILLFVILVISLLALNTPIPD